MSTASSLGYVEVPLTPFVPFVCPFGFALPTVVMMSARFEPFRTDLTARMVEQALKIESLEDSADQQFRDRRSPTWNIHLQSAFIDIAGGN